MVQNITGFESLESRRMLSAVLNGNTLFIRGSENIDNTVTVELDGTGSQIQVTVNEDAPLLFDKSVVELLSIRTYNGNDVITVDGAVSKCTRIMSGTGDDTITTGSERDLIYSGPGNDTINAGDGKNFIVSWTGDDNITSGSSNDIILAGSGNDAVSSGDGRDFVKGYSGDDSIDGGAGHDRIYGGDGSDTLIGGDGNDRLWGQAGNDSLDGGNGIDSLGGVLGTANTVLGGDGKDIFFVKTLTGQTSDFDPAVDVLHANSDSTSTDT